MDQIAGARYITLRAALGLEIKTGMHASRGVSIMAILQREGITAARTKKKAWDDIDKFCTDNGLPAGIKRW
jgi:hypothetical protein